MPWTSRTSTSRQLEACQSLTPDYLGLLISRTGRHGVKRINQSSDDKRIEAVCRQLQAPNQSVDEITRVATVLLSARTQDAVSHLFKLLNNDPSEAVLKNSLLLITDLVRRSGEWILPLEKSINRRGRCPPSLHKSVRKILSDRDRLLESGPENIDREMLVLDASPTRQVQEEIQPPNITTSQRGLLSRKTVAELPVMTAEQSGARGMEALADALARIDPPPDELRVDFRDVDHVYVVGLAAIRCWAEKNNVQLQAINASRATSDYLARIGFEQRTAAASSLPEAVSPDFLLEFKPLGQGVQPEDVSASLVSIIDHNMHLAQSHRASLSTVLAELVENVYRHGGDGARGLAVAQVYPKRNRLTICIVDSGMGVTESIETGENEELKSRLAGGQTALELASTALVTSKPSRHSGYGLYIAREAVVRNGGTFKLVSGRESLTAYRNDWRHCARTGIMESGWPGTWIAMIIDLDSTLSITDVYRTLPLMPGVDAVEDFFSDS